MLKTPQGVSLCGCHQRVQFLVRACRVHLFIIEEERGRLCKVLLAEASRATSNIFCLRAVHSDVSFIPLFFLTFKRWIGYWIWFSSLLSYWNKGILNINLNTYIHTYIQCSTYTHMHGWNQITMTQFENGSSIGFYWRAVIVQVHVASLLWSLLTPQPLKCLLKTHKCVYCCAVISGCFADWRTRNRQDCHHQELHVQIWSWGPHGQKSQLLLCHHTSHVPGIL